MKKLKNIVPALAIALPLLAFAAFSSANGGFYAAIANAGYGGQPSGQGYKQTFVASFNGGTASASATNDEREIDYNVTITSGTVSDITLFCATGSSVASLYHANTSTTDTSFSGVLTQSDIMASAVTCNPNIHDAAQLIQAFREGGIYLVATTSTGSVRGQFGNAPIATNPSNGGGTTTPTHPTVSPAAQTITAEQHVDFNGRDFAHEEDVTIMLDGAVIGHAHADGGGNFSTGSLTAPATPGDHTYSFTGYASNQVVTVTVTVS